ncbi:Terpene cyclase [Mycena kentingensis (nom. inval.)]|nr:Terpene cyclase [Mycena kentingensis (nom. inval.)]
MFSESENQPAATPTSVPERTLLRIPETLRNWPWQRRINPHFEECKRESQTWFDAFHAYSPKKQESINRCDFNLLAALGYPLLTKEGCRIGCDLMNLCCLIDEGTDDQPPAVVRQQVDSVKDAMRNPAKARPDDEWVGAEVARQFWLNAIRTITPMTQPRFLDAYFAYLDAMVDEAHDRTTHVVRDVPSYFVLRRRTIGSRPAFTMCAAHLTLPSSVLDHPVVAKLADLTVDAFIITNDLCSYNVEQARDEHAHNLVTVVMQQYAFGVQQAMDWILARHDALVDEFFATWNELPTFLGPVDRELRMEDYTSQDRIADRHRLSLLITEMQALDSSSVAYSSLHRDSETIQARLAAYKYPVLTLPNEIVSEIFLSFIPPYPKRPRLKGAESPLKLSRICSLWRNIAFQTPALWRAMDIAFIVPEDVKHSDAIVSAISVWLQRSGTLLLSLSLGRCDPDARQMRSSLLATFAVHSSRWEYMTLRRTDAPEVSSVTALPSLVACDLHLGYNDHWGTNSIGLPRLSRAIIRDAYDRVLPAGFLPWAQLTQLTLENFDIPAVEAVLRAAHKLVQCRLSFDEESYKETSYDHKVEIPIHLPRLEALVVEFSLSNDGIRALLRAFRVPMLKRFFVHEDLMTDRSPTDLAALVQAFGCAQTLERLFVSGLGYDRATIEYRAAFPDVLRVECPSEYRWNSADGEWGVWEV